VIDHNVPVLLLIEMQISNALGVKMRREKLPESNNELNTKSSVTLSSSRNKSTMMRRGLIRTTRMLTRFTLLVSQILAQAMTHSPPL
jgi:hypothetical protein